MGESPTLGKFGRNFGRRGKEEIGKEAKRGGKGKREARKQGEMERTRREVVKGNEEN